MSMNFAIQNVIFVLTGVTALMVSVKEYKMRTSFLPMVPARRESTFVSTDTVARMEGATQAIVGLLLLGLVTLARQELMIVKVDTSALMERVR